MLAPDLFISSFGRECAVLARAPGRVNLIGEHTDYNEGLVLPVALAQSAWVAIALRPDDTITVKALDLAATASWAPGGWRAAEQPGWSAYVAGAAESLRARGASLRGFDLLVQSDVPAGAGLASSAALTVACAFGLAFAAGDALEATELVDLCQAVEADYAGVPCGIMDQTVALQARCGHALLLDCRSRQVDHVPLQLGGHALLVVNSGIRHRLADGDYGRRRAECAAAAAYFRQRNPTVRSLRDVTPEAVRKQALEMNPVLAARALHVTSETQRVRAAVSALGRGDLAGLGRLMNASHASLRDQYEVSCPEVDRLVAALQGAGGVLGARMTGAGFGGAVVVLCAAEAVGAVERIADELSLAEAGQRVLQVHPGDGAKIVIG